MFLNAVAIPFGSGLGALGFLWCSGSARVHKGASGSLVVSSSFSDCLFSSLSFSSGVRLWRWLTDEPAACAVCTPLWWWCDPSAAAATGCLVVTTTTSNTANVASARANLCTARAGRSLNRPPRPYLGVECHPCDVCCVTRVRSHHHDLSSSPGHRHRHRRAIAFDRYSTVASR